MDVSDNFGQTQPDLLTPVTPANSENINYFSTGPDLTLRLAPTTELRLGARYSLVNYQISPFDSDRVSGSLVLTRSIAERSSVSLNAEHDRVEFANQSVNLTSIPTRSTLPTVPKAIAPSSHQRRRQSHHDVRHHGQ